MKPSVLEIRRVAAMEAMADNASTILEQLARIETKLDQLLADAPAVKFSEPITGIVEESQALPDPLSPAPSHKSGSKKK